MWTTPVQCFGVQPLRASLRAWAFAPAFALGTAATLSVGAAALVCVFALVNATLLRPLPYPDADRLVVLQNAWRTRPVRHSMVSAPRARAWQASAQSIDAMALFMPARPIGGVLHGEPRLLSAAQASASFFGLLGASAARGRVFLPEEDLPGAAAVAMLSHAFWVREYGADPAAVGQSVTIEGQPSVIVGVLRPDFDARSLAPGVVEPPDVWAPLRLEPASADDANTLVAVGRLRPSVSIDAARRDAEQGAEAFRAAFPEGLPAEGTFDLVALKDLAGADVRSSLFLLLAAVSLLAVLIVANVTSLMLARAASRRQEFAVRTALGAGRLQLAAQAVMEMGTLTAVSVGAGSAAGLAAAMLLIHSGVVRLPRVGPASVAELADTTVLALAGGAWLAMVVWFSLVQIAIAVRSGSRLDPELRLASRSGTGPDRPHAWLLALEMALACVLVIGAALLTRSLLALQRVDPGIDRQGVLTLQTPLGGSRLGASAAALPVFDEGQRRIAETPGVDAVAMAFTGVPPAQGGALRVDVVGRSTEDQYMASWDLVTPHYFAALGLRLIEGRLFDQRDRAGAAAVVIVNETLARQLWPNESPLGRRIAIGRGGGPAWDEGVTREIVGVVSDARQFGLARPAFQGTYVPLAQAPDAQIAWFNERSLPATWIVRTAPAGGPSARVIEDELRRATALPVAAVRSMDEVMSAAIASEIRTARVMTVMGALSTLVAIVGVFSLTLYAVQQRTREFAIRIALGARAHHVNRLVVTRTMGAVLLGIVAGLAASAGLATLLGSALYGVERHDAFTFIVVPAALAGAAGLAAYLPARRSASLDSIASHLAITR